ncbi:MAG: hypothetical protein ACI91F_000206 [Candidatus Binatia bacterium]|jgi:hypothetical protein
MVEVLSVAREPKAHSSFDRAPGNRSPAPGRTYRLQQSAQTVGSYPDSWSLAPGANTQETTPGNSPRGLLPLAVDSWMQKFAASAVLGPTNSAKPKIPATIAPKNFVPILVVISVLLFWDTPFGLLPL